MTATTLRSLAALTVLTVLFSACRTQKQNLNYFSADQRDSSHTRIWQQYEVKIQPGDKLSIFVTALNPESAKPYNLSSGTGTAVLAQGSGITVDSDGRILYPQLGFIQAAGLTKTELRDTLLNRLRTYLTDPVVTVDFINLKVTVLGEVARQGPIPLNDGSLTLLEALGMAGDIVPTGRRDSILVVREINGQREFGYVNLLSNELFKSPYYTLRQNDVVYVSMSNKRLREETEARNARNMQLAMTISTVVATLGFFIINITRR